MLTIGFVFLSHFLIVFGRLNSNQSLPSGWDASAEKMYHNQIKLCAKTTRENPSVIKEITIAPAGPFSFYTGPITANHQINLLADYAVGIQEWEPYTFQTYIVYLTAATHYVDFGTWVGPTMLFAAQFVESAVGIEADPVAFAVMSFNAKLNFNRQWGRQIHLVAGGVGVGEFSTAVPVNQVMSSLGAGGSCSGFSNISLGCTLEKKKMMKWHVNTFTLPNIMKHFHVPTTPKTFIKVDVESFECFLIPAWIEWLRPFGHAKPTFFLSFHHHGQCTSEQYFFVLQFAKLFKAVLHDTGEPAPLGSSWEYKAETMILTDWAA